MENYTMTNPRNEILFTIQLPKKTEDGELTKAGNIIRSILQFDIQLPALFFWEKENGEYNIHDGKQRILSLYYFIKPNKDINIITRLHGKEYGYIGLEKEQREKLLDYKFDIVVKKGKPEQEENSFYLINTNSEPLTDYESLRGMFHGTWIYEFEKYLEAKSKVIDKIVKIGRGLQSILFLYNCFGLLGEKDAPLRVRTYLRGIRNNSFEQQDYDLDKIIEIFAEFSKITSVKDEKAIQVASYIVAKGWDKDKIMDYYRKRMREINDIKSWKMETHRVAITRLIQDNIECDGKRLFTDEDKSVLYKRSQRCAEIGCSISSYKELETDHFTPWSKGGSTILGNAQLLCKLHNASKCDEDGVKG